MSRGGRGGGPGPRGEGAAGAESLLNVGPKSRAWLTEIGVTRREQIVELGPVEICRRMRAAGRQVSVVMAYALEGAVTGTHWNEIPGETKRWLRAEFARMRLGEKAGR
jgi:DNA transformation protein and related proteins